MKALVAMIGWIAGLFFVLLVFSMLILKNWLAAIFLFVAALLLLPPVAAWIQGWMGVRIPGWARGLIALVLFAVSLVSLMGGDATSVYLTPEAEAAHMAIYDAKLAKWPVPYESVMVDTSYGTVHVLVSGPDDGPPMVLLNASGMSGWSWLPNVGPLNQVYRTYAIDTLGEAGKSRLDDLENTPVDGKAWTDLLIEVTEYFGIHRSEVVGASYGGYLATNYARYAPERVQSLALLGPMGLTPSTGKTVARIMIAQFFPLPWIQNWVGQWALGDDPDVQAEAGEWFQTIVTGMFPKVSMPVTFLPQELQEVQAPTLLILGAKDNLTGDPDDVRQLAENVPDIDIHVLDSGHLIGIEAADEVNELLLGFLSE